MKHQNKPAISVIMSTYNEPLKRITEGINSILNQTFSDFEFIIINDNPKRKELQEFLEKYKKQDKRIVLIKNKQNIGLTKSLNKGLRKAKGKYIARMDADDISLPKRFQIQYGYLEEHKEIFLCGGSFQYIDKNGKVFSTQVMNYSCEKVKKTILKTGSIHHPTVMFRNNSDLLYREKFKYAQDMDLWLRMLTGNKKLEVIPNILLKWRVEENSISHSRYGQQKLFVMKAKEFYGERLRGCEDSYASFNEKEILELPSGRGSLMSAEIRRIKLIFRNEENMPKFREEFRRFIKKNGLTSWNMGKILFLVSFLPVYFRRLFMKMIWGKY